MAVDALVKRFLDERDQKVTLIETLAATAEDEGRDLYSTDLETISNARARIVELDSQIDKVGGDLQMADAVKSRIRSLDPSIVTRDFQYRSAGEYMYDLLHRSEDETCNARFQKFHRRAAEHLGLDKANTIPVAGGFNGLVVAGTSGAVLDPSPSGSPLFSALGAIPAPGSQFTRPRIVDPNFATGVAAQGQEKAELVSKTWDIVSEVLTLKAYGGYINVSEWLLEQISGSLDMVVSHMNRRLENLRETATVTELAKTSAVVAAADGSAAAITAALGEAAALLFNNTGQLPQWIAMGPNGYGALIGLSDLAGRPMFPPVAPSNALGTGGLTEFGSGTPRWVVTQGITDTSLYMGNRYGLEVYERRMPVFSAVEPAVLGRQIAVATGLAFYRPITAEAGAGNVPPEERNGVVKITGL
jgi:HK97 family phage major capsid protein